MLRPTDEAKNGLETLDMPEKTKLPNNCEMRRKLEQSLSSFDNFAVSTGKFSNPFNKAGRSAGIKE